MNLFLKKLPKKAVSFFLLMSLSLEGCKYGDNTGGMRQTQLDVSKNTEAEMDSEIPASGKVSSRSSIYTEESPISSKKKASNGLKIGAAFVGGLAVAGLAVGLGIGIPYSNQSAEISALQNQVNGLSVQLYGKVGTGSTGAGRLLQTETQTYTPGCLGLLNGYVDLVNGSQVYGFKSALLGNSTVIPDALVVNNLNTSTAIQGAINLVEGLVQNVTNYLNSWSQSQNGTSAIIATLAQSSALCNQKLASNANDLATYAYNLYGNASALAGCRYDLLNSARGTSTVTTCATYGTSCITCNVAGCVTCSTGFFPTNNGGPCATCSTVVPNCLTCVAPSGVTSCSTCMTGYDVSSGSCVLAPCVQPNCATCTSNVVHACTKCNIGYCMSNGICGTCPTIPIVATNGLRVGYLDSAYEMSTQNPYVSVSQAVQAGYNVVIVAFANVGGSNKLLIGGDQFQAYTSWQTFSACPCSLGAFKNDIALARKNGLKYVLASIGGGGTSIPTVAHANIAAQNIVNMLTTYNLDGVDFDIESQINGDMLSQVMSAIKALNSSIILSAPPQANSVLCGTGQTCSNTQGVSLVTTGTSQDFNQAISAGLFDYLWVQAYNTGPSSNQISWNGSLTDETLATYIPAATDYFTGKLAIKPPVLVPNKTVFVVGEPSQPIAAGDASVWNNPIYPTQTAVLNALSANYVGTPGAMTWSINQDIDNGCAFAKAIFPQFGATNIVCPTNSTSFWNPGNIDLNNCNVCTGLSIAPNCNNLFGQYCSSCTSSACTACISGYTVTNGACTVLPPSGSTTTTTTTGSGCTGGLYPYYGMTNAQAQAAGNCYPCSYYCGSSACSLGNPTGTVCGTSGSSSGSGSGSGSVVCSVANCTTCVTGSTTACAMCNANFILSSGNCITCPITGCAKCSTSGSTCISCNSGYSLGSGNASCIQCPTNCTSCSQSGNTITCSICSSGNSPASNALSCISCSSIPNCASCTLSSGVTSCSSCISGYNLATGGRSCTLGTDVPSQILGMFQQAQTESFMNTYILTSITATNSNVQSTAYRWADFIPSFQYMAFTGVGDNTFYTGTSQKVGLINFAIFLGQSMHETIQYNACDENNWTTGLGVPDYPASAACGQAGQDYSQYKCSSSQKFMECPIDPNMVIVANTHATWYGAPGPMACAPNSLTGGSTPAWNYGGGWCNPTLAGNVPSSAKDWIIQNIVNRDTCSAYGGQQAGQFSAASCPSGGCPNTAQMNTVGGTIKTDIQGCCWWGRGIIQTTGPCNIGMLNYYLAGWGYANNANNVWAKYQFDPSAKYSNLNFCENPQTICNPLYPELKVEAGMLYWIESVQGYDGTGTSYSTWDYITQLEANSAAIFANPKGPEAAALVNAVSGIVNRGCPALTCPGSGGVLSAPERLNNFIEVMDVLKYMYDPVNNPNPSTILTPAPAATS